MISQVRRDCYETCDANIEGKGHAVIHSTPRGIGDSGSGGNACEHNTGDVEEEMEELISSGRLFVFLSYGGKGNACCESGGEKEEKEKGVDKYGFEGVPQHRGRDTQ